MNLPFYIAHHLYTGGQDKQKASQPAMRIAMLGIAIGMAVMLVSVAVVLGFKHTIRDKVVGFGSHIVVTNVLTAQTTDQSHPILANDSLMKVLGGVDGVRHVQRYSIKQGVLKTDKDFLGVAFKGVGEDFDTTFIASNLVEGVMPQLSAKKSTQQLLLSKIMADKLRLKVGDKVFAYFLGDSEVRARPFTVKGIYQTNLTRYDEAICFTDLYTISKLNGWSMLPDEDEIEVSGCEITVEKFDSVRSVHDVMKRTVDGKLDGTGYHELSSATIYDTNPQIFSWLSLLDLNVWIILILMVCVVGFTMVSGLLIIILERTSMIGVMKAIGARNSLVRTTFRWLAMFIVIKGMVIGNVLGIGICLLQKYTGLIKLDPASYYVTEAPVELNWWVFLLLNVVTFVITVLILVVPSFYVSMIRPAKTMTME